MLWIPSANTARVTHENAFQLCAQKKSIISLSQSSSKTVNPIVCPLRTQSFYCNQHICLVFPIFQHHKEFFLDLGLVYSASLGQWCSELPLAILCRGSRTVHRAEPFLAEITPGLSAQLRNGHSDPKHIDKWFQQHTNAEPGLNPGSDTITAGRAFDDLTGTWSFAPHDLASSRGIFYEKIQFYCIVNIIWQLQVKVSSLIAWKETKSSQIQTHTHGEKIHHVLPELWGKQHRNCVWTGALTRRCSVCHPKPSPAELVLLTIVGLFLKNPRSSNLEILCIATQMFCTSAVCLQAAGMPKLIF